MADRFLMSLLLGVTGAVLMISGIKKVRPSLVLRQLLETGTLPTTGATSLVAKSKTAAPVGPPMSPAQIAKATG